MRILAAAFLAAVMLAAQGGGASAADKLTVLLDWFVNPDHAPLLVAKEKGYFADENLDVDLVAPADPNDPPKLVAAGKGDIAVSYEPQLHLQHDAGMPLVRIGTLIATPLNCVLVRKDSAIRSLADLKGRRIGYSVAGTEEAVLGAMLHSVGLTLQDVDLINVNFSLVPALLSKKVDAVIGAYRNFELNQMAIEGVPGRAFYVEEHGVPPFDQLIFEAREDRTGDPRLRRFLDAVERGTQFLVNHPEDSWTLFVKGRKDLDTELNRRAWKDTIRRFALRPAALDHHRYDRFARFLKAHDLIGTVPPVEDYAVELR